MSGLTLEMTRTTALVVAGGRDVRFERGVLRNAGQSGASIDGTAHVIDATELHDLGERGVALSGGNRARLTPAGNALTNSHVHHFGRWGWTYFPAVSLSGVGQIVTNNLFEKAPHAAMLFSGNDHRIERNEIRDVCDHTSDAGAIYAGRDWSYRGTVIRHNFVHDIKSAFRGGIHGVYLDDTLSGITVEGNVFYRVSGNAILHGGGRDDVMVNNIAARCGRAMTTDNRGRVRITHNPGDSWNILERLGRDGIQYQADPWAQRYPALAAVPNDWAIMGDPGLGWLYPEGNVFARNVSFGNGRFVVEVASGGPGALGHFAQVADNLDGVDPRFVDEANLDLRLAPDSPAWALPGFEAIPFEHIGPGR